jgi:hypothetical protein
LTTIENNSYFGKRRGQIFVRTTLFAFCALLALVGGAGGQLGDTDPYSLNVVKFELQMRLGGQKVIHGFSQKSLFRLGDGVAVALLKILDQEALMDPQTVKGFLPIVKDSFSQPKLISIEADKTPRVTLFLLDHIRRNIADVQVRQDLQQTMEFVKEMTVEHQP